MQRQNGEFQEKQIDHAGIENLPDLFSRLSEQVVKLFETKVQLLRVEIRDDVNTYIRNGILFGLGAVLLIVGFVLFNIVIGFLLATFFAFTEQKLNYIFGFAAITVKMQERQAMSVANEVIPIVSRSKSCVWQNRAAHSCKSKGQRERAETNRSDAPLE